MKSARPDPHLRSASADAASSERPTDHGDDASGLSLRMEVVTLCFRPLRVIVGLDYKAADAWFIEF